MSKHTPGPWHASQYLDNGEWGIVTDGFNAQIVVGLSSRITKANALLIAAAPEMRDLLSLLVEIAPTDSSKQGIDKLSLLGLAARQILEKIEDAPGAYRIVRK